MLKSVNDNAGVPYIQPMRGSITFPQYEGAPVTIPPREGRGPLYLRA